MRTLKPIISPFRLSSLLRLQKEATVAFQLFQNPNPNDMNPQKPIRRSILSYDLIITKLGRAKMFDELEQVLHQLKQETRLVPPEIIFCNLINFYGRARLSDRALSVFEEIPSFRCQMTVKSVNSLLNALLRCCKFDKMREVFMSMKRYAKPDACTYNILIRGCSESGCFDEAWKVFDEMQRNDLMPNVLTFGTLINGLCVELKVKEALKLKDDMLKIYGVLPNCYVYTSLVKGLCGVNELSLAFKLKEEMVKNKMKMDSAVYSTLCRALFKDGKKEEVSHLLAEMKENGCKPDVVTYNVMISGFCEESNFEGAFKTLAEMVENETKPDVVSYNVILSGLCKVGRLREANDLFEDMPKRGCIPDVVSYRILFDEFCRFKLFNEAASILDEMSFKGYKPRSSSLHNFVHELCHVEEFEVLKSVLSSVGKENGIDSELWGAVVSTVCKEDNLLLWQGIVDIVGR